MDHFQHHLAKLRDAMVRGDRPEASRLAGDFADIFAALNSNSSAPFHSAGTIPAARAALALTSGNSGNFQRQVAR